MKINVINLDNQHIGEAVLSPDIYQQPVRVDILHKIVEWQRAKKRSGTRKTKGISEISGTTKKPHAQKGTGRARQGSLRSPQMRGGAVIFGPVVRDHGYSMPKKVRALALKIALSSKAVEQKIVVLDNLSINNHKTKDLSSKLKVLGLNSALFVGFDSKRDENFGRAYRNIKNIDVLPTSAINVYDILNHEHLVLTNEAVGFINTKFAVQDLPEIERSSNDTKSTSKLASGSEMREESERRIGVYLGIHEDPSTESTKQIAAEVEFKKKAVKKVKKTEGDQ